MALNINTRYASDEEFLYKNASTSELFDNNMYKSLIDIGEIDDATNYLYEIYDASNKDLTQTSFNNIEYNLLKDSQDKRLYLEKNLYGDSFDENQYSEVSSYLDQQLKQAKADETYAQLSGLTKTVSTIGGTVGNILLELMDVGEEIGQTGEAITNSLMGLILSGEAKERYISNAEQNAKNKTYLISGVTQDALNEFNNTYTSINRNKIVNNINSIGMSIANMAPALLFNPVGGFAAAVGQGIYWSTIPGQFYQSGLESGLSGNTLAAYTALMTGVEVGTEMMFKDQTITNGIFKNQASNLLVELFPKQMMQEGIEEAVAEVGDALINKYFLYKDDDNVGWLPSLSDVVNAALIGGITAGILSGISVATTTNIDGLNKLETMTFNYSLNQLSQFKNRDILLDAAVKNNYDSIEALKEGNPELYNQTLKKQSKENTRVVELTHALGVLYDTMGEKQFADALKLVNNLSTYQENIKNNVILAQQNNYKVSDDVKKDFTKNYPNLSVEVISNLTPAQNKVINNVKKSFNKDVYVVRLGSETGNLGKVNSIVVNDKTIFITDQAFNKYNYSQIANEIVANDLIKTLQMNGNILSKENMDKINELLNLEYTKTTSLLEQSLSQKATSKDLLFNQKLVEKIFLGERNSFVKVYNWLKKTLKLTDKGTEKYAMVNKVINMYKATAYENAHNSDDFTVIGDLLDDTDNIDNEIAKSTSPFYTTALTVNSDDISVAYRIKAYSYLIQNKADGYVVTGFENTKEDALRNKLDFTQIYKESYYRPEFVQQMKELYKNEDFLWCLQEYMYYNYNHIISLQDEGLVQPIDLFEYINPVIKEDFIDASIGRESSLTIKNYFDKNIKVVSDLLDKARVSDDLWKKYKEVKIITTVGQIRGGQTNYQSGELVVNLRFGRNSNMAAILDLLEHEMIHVSQAITGLSRGSSPFSIRQGLNKLSQNEINDLIHKMYVKQFWTELENDPATLNDLATQLYKYTTGEMDANRLGLGLQKILTVSRTNPNGFYAKNNTLFGFGKFENIKIDLAQYGDRFDTYGKNPKRLSMEEILGNQEVGMKVDDIVEDLSDYTYSELIDELGFSEELARLVVTEDLTQENLQELINNDDLGDNRAIKYLSDNNVNLTKKETVKKQVEKKQKTIKKDNITLNSKENISRWLGQYTDEDLKQLGFTESFIQQGRSNDLTVQKIKQHISKETAGNTQAINILIRKVYPNNENIKSVADVDLYVTKYAPVIFGLEQDDRSTKVYSKEEITDDMVNKYAKQVNLFSKYENHAQNAGQVMHYILQNDFNLKYKDVARLYKSLKQGLIAKSEQASSVVDKLSNKKGETDETTIEDIGEESIQDNIYNIDKSKKYLDYTKLTKEQLIQGLEQYKNDLDSLDQLSKIYVRDKQQIITQFGKEFYETELQPKMVNSASIKSQIFQLHAKYEASNVKYNKQELSKEVTTVNGKKIRETIPVQDMLSYLNYLKNVDTTQKKEVKKKVIPVKKTEIKKVVPTEEKTAVKEKTEIKKVVPTEEKTAVKEKTETGKFKNKILNKLFEYELTTRVQTEIQILDDSFKKDNDFLQATYNDFAFENREWLESINKDNFDDILIELSHFKTTLLDSDNLVKRMIITYLAARNDMITGLLTVEQSQKLQTYATAVVRISGQTLNMLGKAMKTAIIYSNPKDATISEIKKEYGAEVAKQVEESFTEEDMKAYFKAVREGDYNARAELAEKWKQAIIENLPKDRFKFLEKGLTRSERKSRFNRFAKSLNSFRYLAMLSRPSTHFKNMVSNYGMQLLNGATDYVVAQIQQHMKFDAGQFKEVPDDLKISQDVKDYTYEKIVKNGLAKELAKGSKFENIGKNDLKEAAEFEARFNIKWLNKTGNFIYNNLEKADQKKVEPMIIKKFEQIVQANYGTNLEAIDDGEYMVILTRATQQALITFFKNKNAVSNAMSLYIKKYPMLEVFLGGVVAFPKVSTNIFMTILRYSPLQIGNAIKMQMTATDKTIDADPFYTAKIAKAYSQGAIGTAMMMLGMLLSSIGAIKFDEDEYGGKIIADIGGVKIDLSGLAPSISAMLIGAAITDTTEKYPKVTKKIMAVVNDQTLLGSFDSLFTYNRGIDEILTAPFEMYLKQYVPAIGRAVAKVIDPYAKKTEGKILYQILSGIPFASYLVPDAINPYTGESDLNYGNNRAIDFALAVLNTASPFSVKYQPKTDAELEAIYQNAETTGGSGNFRIGDTEYDLSGKDLELFSSNRGIYINNYLTKLINDGYKAYVRNDDDSYSYLYYSEMTDAQRQNAIKSVYTSATQYAKIKYWTDNGHKYVFTSSENYTKYSDLLPYSTNILRKFNNYKGDKFIK